jgi:hypothetical protein
LRKILHPGLGKCGTTSKQLHYWPQICRLTNWNFISHGNKETTDLEENVYEWFCNISFKNKNSIKISEFKKNIFISDEGLLEGGNSWDPEFFEENINYISSKFDKNYEIILTLRKPSDWLISNYLQYIIEGGTLKIEEFYLNNDDYKRSNYEKKFNIEKLDYKNLIINFRRKFKNVFILFYEQENHFLYKKIFFKEKGTKFLIEKNIIEKKSLSYLSYLILRHLNNYKILRDSKSIKFLIRKLDRFIFQFFLKFPKNHLNKVNFNIKKLDNDYIKLVAGDGFEPPTFRL